MNPSEYANNDDEDEEVKVCDYNVNTVINASKSVVQRSKPSSRRTKTNLRRQVS